MKKPLLLAISVSAGLCVAGSLMADAVSPSAQTQAAAAPASSTASAAPAAVAANDAPGSLKQGKDLLDQGKFADAVAYFNGIGVQSAAHGKTKREPYRQLDLATAYLGEGDYADAETAANAALALSPDLEAAWNDLASAQVNSGDRAAAIATYQKGIAQLTKDGGDHDRLDGNLQGLQTAAGDNSDDSGSAAPASASPSAGTAAPSAPASKSNAAATVGN